MELQRHIDNVRQRIGEVNEGFWLDSEIQGYLNQAQRLVAQHVHSREHPYAVAMQWRTPVRSGAEYYMMEPDILAPNTVAHHKSATRFQRLVERNIDNLRLQEQYYSDTEYLFYQMKGRGSVYIAEGVCDAGSEGFMTDTGKAFTQVRPGDVIYNLNDQDASAVITQVNMDTLNFQDWVGGVSQYFKQGDAYRVRQRERTRNQMFVWPILEFDTPVASATPSKQVFHHTGGSQFSLLLDTVITRIQIDFLRIGMLWNQDTVITVGLKRNGEVIERFSIEDPSLGKQDVSAFEPIHLAPGAIEIDLLGLDNNNMPNQPIDRAWYLIEMDGYHGTRTPEQPSTEYLQIDYTPYPAEMLNARSICELEEFLFEPMYRKAKRLAMEKRNPESPMLTTYDNEYDVSILDAKRTLRSRGEAGPNRVNSDHSSRYYDNAGAQGLTQYVGDPSDFF